MSEPKFFCIPMHDSGDIKSFAPSRCEANDMPSSEILRRLDKLNAWNPPLSVSIGLFHSMNECRPPKRAISSDVGLMFKW